ncbi:MAG: hypothetical protein RLO01_13475 [Thalassobaculaceae bacterium]
MILAALLLVIRPAWGAERDYAQWASKVGALTEKFLGWCNTRPDLLKRDGNVGPLSDPDTFRNACGAGLADRELPHTGWRHFYFREKSPRSEMDVFGISRSIELDGETFILTIGRLTRIAYPHNASPIRKSLADARLFRRAEQNSGYDWLPAWAYVDPVNADWIRPPILFPETRNLSERQAKFYERVWSEHIIRGIPRLLWSLNDRRGFELK